MNQKPEQTKIYQSIKDCDNLPDKEKQKALFFIKKIVAHPCIDFCDSYVLFSCFLFSSAFRYGFGSVLFWVDVDDYLTNRKQK